MTDLPPLYTVMDCNGAPHIAYAPGDLINLSLRVPTFQQFINYTGKNTIGFTRLLESVKRQAGVHTAGAHTKLNDTQRLHERSVYTSNFSIGVHINARQVTRCFSCVPNSINDSALFSPTVHDRRPRAAAHNGNTANSVDLFIHQRKGVECLAVIRYSREMKNRAMCVHITLPLKSR